MSLPSGMTAEKLRDIANCLHQYDRLTSAEVDNPLVAASSLLNKSIRDQLFQWADEIDWLLTVSQHASLD